MAKFKCYEYEWYDHAHKSGWQYDIDTKDYIVHSVGFLVGEDKLHYFFTDGLVPSTAAYHGVMQVLKSAIKRKKVLFTKTFK